MSKKVNSVVCPKCHKQLMQMVNGTNGYIFIRCVNCGSSVKVRASKERISTDAMSGNTDAAN